MPSLGAVLLLAVATTSTQYPAHKAGRSLPHVVNTLPDRPSFLFLLVDDIGYDDFGFSNGSSALTPRISAWAKSPGSIIFRDFHSGGTHCSPTRASVLTGRTPFRDCVFGTKGADSDDMTEEIDNFTFAPQRTFTIADAVRAANASYVSAHFGKWHLGSLYNDSEKYGGVSSSPVTHGFDEFNSTAMVAPTATTNCMCNPAWAPSCLWGHYRNASMGSSSGVCWREQPRKKPPLPIAPGCSRSASDCCYNYWWNNASAPHGISNLSWPVPADDASYLADAFVRFLERRAENGEPFLAQVSFHNNHVPFVATASAKEACSSGKTCRATSPSAGNAAADYNPMQLDFYGALNELDAAVGQILDALELQGYRNNTVIWFTSDNGPEVDCPPLGICAPSHFLTGPGSAGPLRGRKRDVWEGGHRVPGVVAWPAVVGAGAGNQGKESWEATVITSDFLPTIMDVLDVERPETQRDWAMDGTSLLPVLRGQAPARRCIAHNFNDEDGIDTAYRCGPWKLVKYHTPIDGVPRKNKTDMSCTDSSCRGRYLLYDLRTDLGERHDISAEEPAVLASMIANATAFFQSVERSVGHAESNCPSIVVPPGVNPPSK